MTAFAGVSKHHLRSSRSTAISVRVATQYSAAVRTGRIALAVVRPAWNPGLHSSSTLSRLQSRRMRSTTMPVKILRSTSMSARGRWLLRLPPAAPRWFLSVSQISYSTRGPLGPLLARSSGRASLFLVICVCLGGCGPLNPFPCSDLTPFL